MEKEGNLSVLNGKWQVGHGQAVKVFENKDKQLMFIVTEKGEPQFDYLPMDYFDGMLESLLHICILLIIFSFNLIYICHTYLLSIRLQICFARTTSLFKNFSMGVYSFFPKELNLIPLQYNVKIQIEFTCFSFKKKTRSFAGISCYKFSVVNGATQIYTV